MLYKTYGIYSITNIENNKRYIGYTKMNFGDRRDCHFAMLRNNYHYNEQLQNEFNIYGEQNFKFEILEIIDGFGTEYCLERERFYIKKFDTTHTGYNISAGGYGENVPINFSHLQELWSNSRKNMQGIVLLSSTKQKMSETHMANAKRRSGCINTSVLNFDDVLRIREKLMVGESCGALAKEYNVSRSCISLINQNKTWKNVYPDGWIDK